MAVNIYKYIPSSLFQKKARKHEFAGIRTPDTWLKRPVLYQAELRTLFPKEINNIFFLINIYKLFAKKTNIFKGWMNLL